MKHKMVSYPDLSTIQNNSNIGTLLALPNASYPYFWAWILAGVWFITASTLYFKEKERTGRERLLSCMSISSFAIFLLSVIGTIVGFITIDIIIYIVVLNFMIIGIWIFTD